MRCLRQMGSISLLSTKNNEIRRFALLRLAQTARPSPHWAEVARMMNLPE